jgi:hypothetical protein
MHHFSSDEGKIFCDEGDMFGFCSNDCADPDVRSIFENGEEIKDWDDRITLYYDEVKGAEPEDYLDNIYVWPIFSKKMRKICEDLGVKGVQFLPINIKERKTMKEVPGYYVLNICNLIKALDLERSRYRYSVTDPSIIMGLTHPVLKEDKIKGLDILRLQEYEESIFISERLKKAMEEAGITGCDFAEVKLS